MRVVRQAAMFALCAAIAFLTGWSPSPAHAKDMEGRLGLGLEVSSRLEDSGLSFKYWGSNVVGFQSTLTFNGGDIDATADYDVTVETNFNKTVDQLLEMTEEVPTTVTGVVNDSQGPVSGVRVTALPGDEARHAARAEQPDCDALTKITPLICHAGADNAEAR